MMAPIPGARSNVRKPSRAEVREIQIPGSGINGHMTRMVTGYTLPTDSRALRQQEAIQMSFLLDLYPSPPNSERLEALILCGK
jgi:hypothetical protein